LLANKHNADLHHNVCHWFYTVLAEQKELNFCCSRSLYFAGVSFA